MEEKILSSQMPKQELPVAPLKKSKGKIFKIVVGIIILVLVGLGISLYTRAWDPLWNPFRPEPEEVINEMAKKMTDVKTLHSETKFDFLTKEDTKETFKMTMEFWSDSDTTDKENPKSAGNFSLSLAIEGMQFLLAGESKTIGKDSYLKLTTIPASPFLEAYLSQMGIDLSQLKNQWIKIDEESTKNLLKSLGMETEMEEETETKQKEMIEKFQAILKDKKLYLARKEFPDTKIKNQKVYHYLVALNKEGVKKLIPELLKELIKTGIFPQPPTEAEWQEFEKEFPKEFDKFFAKIGDIEGEIWIGKKDLYLYKIKGGKEIDLSKFEEGTKGKITVKLDTNFSNFNQPVKIETPKEYKTLEEILSPFLKLKLESEKAEIISNDMYIISAKAKLIYSQQGSYVNIKNDQEIIFFLTEIERYTGNKPVIHSSKNSFCGYVEIYPTQYLCIDSKGFWDKVFVYPGEKTFCDGKTFVCPPSAPPGL